MQKKYIWIAVLFMTFTLIVPVLAQVSQHYDLGRHLLSGGGGSRSSVHYQIDDVLGQWADGQSSSTHYQIEPGFWGRGSMAEIRQLYLPAQENVSGSGWQAGIQVQNSGTAAAHISYSGIAANGDVIKCGERMTLPGDSANFLTFYGCPSGHPVFNAGVVYMDQPALAITNVGNNLVGTAQGQYRATSRQNAAESIFFPLVKQDHNGRTTAFSVQNTSNDPANITAVFKVNGQTYGKEYNYIPGLSSVLIIPADAGVPGGFGQVGSLSVSGSKPLAGVSLEYEQSAPVARNLQTAAAFSPADYDSQLYCPLYRNAHAAKHNTSGLQVQNVSTAAQTITMTYTPVVGGAQVIRSQKIEPGASATFYAPSIGIPEGSVGSVVVQGEEDIVAVVNESGSEPNGQRLVTAYQCFPSAGATPTVMIPLYKEFYKGNTSGIQVQNVAGDGRMATVELTYRATNSSAQAVFSNHTPIPDGGSLTFWGVSDLLSPPGMVAVSGDPAALAKTYGSVVIKSNTPIVAIANEGSIFPNGSGQDSKNYEGFNR